MTSQAKTGLSILAVATVHSATTAFVPLENRARMDSFISRTNRRRPAGPRRGYSRNNVDDNNNNDLFINPEPVDPASSSSSDRIEFLFNEESNFLDQLKSLSADTDSVILESPGDLRANSESGLAENTVIDFDTDFDINIESIRKTATDDNEDPLISDDLKAVLAASQDAAAEAEARMSPELVDVLDDLATINPPIVPVDLQEQESQTISKVPIIEELSLSTNNSDVNIISPLPNERNAEVIATPSVSKILKFAVPAIGVWLCSPILSLIDTSAVGVLSGTVQQAALNPAVAVTDYAALLIAFLYTGTTNMIASAQESDRGTSDMPRTAKMMVGAMRMSTYVGLGLGAVLIAFARPLLHGIIGNDSISPAVFAAAMKYVRIRAVGMPAAAILGSTQAACLGMQDIRSPLYVLGAAAIVNLLGDIFLVGNSNPLIGGTAGAAWATVLSQYAAVTFFVRWLCHKSKDRTTTTSPEVVNLSDAILEMTSKSDKGDDNGKNRRQSFRNAMESLKLNGRRGKSTRSEQLKDKTLTKKIRSSRLRDVFRQRKMKANKKRVDATKRSSSSHGDSFSTRGFLRDRFTTSDLWNLPDKETRQKFAPYVVPVTSTQVGRVSGYVAMAHVVASSLGTVSMAAQQVIVSIFYCLCPIADSLSLTAQSFVPAIAEKAASMEKASAMKKVLVNFLKAGAIFGGAMMAAVCGIPLVTGFFTADQAVISLVNSVVPLLLVFFGVHGFVCSTEGMILAQKDLGWIGRMYASFFVAVPYFMLGLKKKALAGSKSVGLTSVWTVFISYQLARCALWVTRSATLQRRINVEAKQATSTDTTNMLAP